MLLPDTTRRVRRAALAPVATLAAIALLVLPGLLAAALPAGGPASILAPATAAAAEDPLRLTATATYTLQPEKRLVHVAVTINATNLKPPTRQTVSGGVRITDYYYDRVGFALHEDATKVAATASGSKVSVKKTPRDGYLEISVPFKGTLDYKETQKLKLDFDLPGGAPRSDSAIRVGSAYSTFYAWAWGDAGRSSVSVVIPDGFELDLQGSDMTRSTKDGNTILTAKKIADPTEWYVVVSADRPSSLTSTVLEVANAPGVTVHAWPEDTEWSAQVGDLLTRGLPELRERIGLERKLDDLAVTEVYTPLLEGYAGLFRPSSGEIEIGEDLDGLTIVHEAAHVWFNSDLFSERWINEGLADVYAATILPSIGAARPSPDAVSPTDEVAFALNAWEPPGRIDDDASQARETFGYDAAWTLTQQIVRLVGEAGMQAVFAAADAGAISYVGAGEPETGFDSTDWRRYLDLLEERGGTDKVADLFETWVVTAGQEADLATRAEARAAYAGLVESGGEWAVPPYVRYPMSRWQFATAEDRIDDSLAVLTKRDDLVATARAMGLTVPDDVETAYEAADASLDDATALIAADRESLATIGQATTTLGAERDFFTQVGLGEDDPNAELTAARTAYEAGDDGEVEAAAGRAEALLAEAPEKGRTLVFTTAGIVVAGLLVLLVLLFVLLRLRRGRRRRDAVALAEAAGPGPSIFLSSAPALESTWPTVESIQATPESSQPTLESIEPWVAPPPPPPPPGASTDRPDLPDQPAPGYPVRTEPAAPEPADPGPIPEEPPRP